MADLHLEEASTILFNWLSQARTGGVRLLAGGSTRLIDWQTVHSDVTRVAEYLKASNVSAGCRVGIRGENCYQWLALDLAPSFDWALFLWLFRWPISRVRAMRRSHASTGW